MPLKSNKQNGFTIIELAIVLMIVGIMLGMYLKMYQLWKESKDFYAVESNLDNASEVIFAFRSIHGRYPCPADPALVPGDVGYGEEDCTLANIAGENNTLAAVAGLPLIPNVLLGMFPLYAFGSSGEEVSMRSLLSKVKLESAGLNDPWNDTFTYAVTEELTNAVTFDSTRGSIRIIDEDNLDTGGTNRDAHFVILSRGKDFDCVGRGPTEDENCDGDAVFSIDLYSTDDNLANYYDDVIRFERSASVGIWTNRIDTTGATAVATEDIFPMNTGKIHIGDTGYDFAPHSTLNLELDVEGSILSENAIGADLICDDSDLATATCFQPQTLYDLECPAEGWYMTGVTINTSNELRPVCTELELVVPAALADRTCADSNDYLRGIYSDGVGRGGQAILCERP